MSNEITTFENTQNAVWVRQTKRGAVERGVIGVMASGNKAERSDAAILLAHALANNNNWQAVMKDLVRVFAPSSLKTQSTSYNKETGTLYFYEAQADGKLLMTPFKAGETVCNKSIAMAYMTAVCAVSDSKDLAGKSFKGEKALFAEFCKNRVSIELARKAQRELANA